MGIIYATEVMVVGEGFEPSKSMTADLQSAPFGRSGTPPGVIHIVGRALRCWWEKDYLSLRTSPFPDKGKLLHRSSS